MNKQRLTRPVVVVTLALTVNLIWGSAFPAIKLGYQAFSIAQSDFATIVLFAGTRYFLAGAVIILAGSVTQKQLLLPTKKNIRYVISLATVRTVIQQVLYYIGLAYTSSARCSIINGTSVFFSIIVAALIFHQEKLKGHTILGCVVGFAGVLVLNLGGTTHGDIFLGDMLTMLSTVCIAFGAPMIKKYTKSINLMTLTGWQMLFGGFLLVVVGVFMGGCLEFTSVKCYGSVLWLVLITAIADPTWNMLLKYNSVSSVSVFMFTLPLFGVLLSAVFLGNDGQIFQVKTLLALILVCTGIYMIHKPDKAENRKTSP
ncbi:MAG: DMT family transporter [Clostridia bacterium]